MADSHSHCRASPPPPPAPSLLSLSLSRLLSGCVDFALVFAANYDKFKGALGSKVVEVLLPRLPPPSDTHDGPVSREGTAVVGCATAGLMGVGPGGAFELDPGSGGGRMSRVSSGVALLLGRMPGCRVRAFCNLSPSLPGGTASASGGGRGGGRGRRRSSPRHSAPTLKLKLENANRAVIEWLRKGVAATDSAAAATAAAAVGPTTNTIAGTAAAGTISTSAPTPTPATDTASITVNATDNSAADGDGGGGSERQSRGVDDGNGSTAAAAAAAATGGSVGAGALESEPVVSARDLGLQSVWLMGGSSGGLDLLLAHGGLLRWLQADEQVNEVGVGKVVLGARPVIAGGVSSGSGDLIFHPGRKGRGHGAAVEEAAEAPGPSSSSSSSSKQVGATAAVDLDDWDPAAVKGLQYVGLAVMTEAPAAATTAAGSAAAIRSAMQLPAGAVPEPPLATVRACALAMRGFAGLPGQRVFQRVSIAREALPGSGFRGAVSGSDSNNDSDSEDEDAGDLLTVTGGAPSGHKSLHEELLDMWRRTRMLPQLAVWLARRGDASLHRGLDVQVFRSGEMLMGLVEPSLLVRHGIVAFHSADVAALDAITAGAREAGAVGCGMHLHAELPVLRSVVSPCPLLPGGRPDPGSWEGYAVVQRAALRAGARAGPVAMAVFSCTGRGGSIFGEDSAECEAGIADQVLQQGVPFVGAYCNGELGPYVRNGYVGWFFNPLRGPVRGGKDGPPAKRARVALEDFKCDFGASEGKANKSLSGQCAHIEKCYNAVMDIEDAWRNVLAARPGEERFRNIEAMETAITDGKAVFRGVAKELVVAYNHGWEVVHEMRGMAYAETEEERKALKQAVKAVAGKKPKQAKPASVPAGSAWCRGVQFSSLPIAVLFGAFRGLLLAM
ncbi:hypothetical protein VOLCADRAFT_106819 [Volvox carteri f. nagariensis]|uniref:FIST C-domain domain-containing protein n=1 Tax=Volvox carteri f. nagariensis TaxID=3068 RepID=D8U9Z7_VOLCA|nr:uncharacterized protein VOLCADRAFT_106819 [Volvox carteri f. nagariensis]EFJ43558.1 hypothetical protein VOLCADRAFT_106819 [Volvox carteri f. nagariensis]|eukprot:XP_002955487.1 hypothetical protein VOLCADRAFT_106819 [Volvox carteri f. nagariensis]